VGVRSTATHTTASNRSRVPSTTPPARACAPQTYFLGDAAPSRETYATPHEAAYYFDKRAQAEFHHGWAAYVGALNGLRYADLEGLVVGDAHAPAATAAAPGDAAAAGSTSADGTGTGGQQQQPEEEALSAVFAPGRAFTVEGLPALVGTPAHARAPRLPGHVAEGAASITARLQALLPPGVSAGGGPGSGGGLSAAVAAAAAASSSVANGGSGGLFLGTSSLPRSWRAQHAGAGGTAGAGAGYAASSSSAAAAAAAAPYAGQPPNKRWRWDEEGADVGGGGDDSSSGGAAGGALEGLTDYDTAALYASFNSSS
jgi:hypothetical protein